MAISFDLGPKATWSPFLYGDFEYDRGHKIDLRSSAGFGLTCNLIRTRNGPVSLSAAVAPPELDNGRAPPQVARPDAGGGEAGAPAVITTASDSMEYVSPNLPRRIEGWVSPILGLPMPIVSYGDRGHPLLLFPTAAADFLENERFFLIKAIEPAIFDGRVRVFSIDSINRLAWMDRSLPVAEQARRQMLYARYIEEEVVPYVRNVVGNPEARIATTGASFGAFHAANTLFRRPDLFDGLIAMSGFYDLGPDYLHGYSDDNVFFNNPAWYLPGLGGRFLDLLRHTCRIVVVCGQGAWEAPDASRRLSEVLNSKGIPNLLDFWGLDVSHDWPWWRKMLPHHLATIGI